MFFFSDFFVRVLQISPVLRKLSAFSTATHMAKGSMKSISIAHGFPLYAYFRSQPTLIKPGSNLPRDASTPNPIDSPPFWVLIPVRVPRASESPRAVALVKTSWSAPCVLVSTSHDDGGVQPCPLRAVHPIASRIQPHAERWRWYLPFAITFAPPRYKPTCDSRQHKQVGVKRHSITDRADTFPKD